MRVGEDGCEGEGDGGYEGEDEDEGGCEGKDEDEDG